MPFVAEHACRIRSPDLYSEFRRREIRTREGRRLAMILGRRKDDPDRWEVQAWRYPVSDWTREQARAHCQRNRGIRFEPAQGNREQR